MLTRLFRKGDVAGPLALAALVAAAVLAAASLEALLHRGPGGEVLRMGHDVGVGIQVTWKAGLTAAGPLDQL